MSNDVFNNRYENSRNLLAIHNVSLKQFCNHNELSFYSAYDMFGSEGTRRKDMSDKIARKYEMAFGVERFSLDQSNAEWAREAARVAALAESQRVSAISSMLADDVAIARYWNLRQILQERNISTSTLSDLTGVHVVHCRKFGSEKPSMPISNQMARRIEVGLGLAESSLDITSLGKATANEPYFPVPPGAVKFLGLGPFLYRYGHIRQIIEERGLNQSQIIKLPGFTPKGLKDVLGDTPVSVISQKMARSCEEYLGLEPGYVDRPVGQYDIEPDNPEFLVTMEALMLNGDGEHLHRYVNLRKELYFRGLSGYDLIDLIELNRLTVLPALSCQPTKRISSKFARMAEAALSLEEMSLDIPVVYKMEGEPTKVQAPIIESNKSSSSRIPATFRFRKDSEKSEIAINKAFASSIRTNDFTLVRALFATHKTVGLSDGHLAIMFHQQNMSVYLKQRLADGHFSAMQQQECLGNVAMEAISKAISKPWGEESVESRLITSLRDKQRKGYLIPADEFRSGIFSDNPLTNDELKALPYLLSQYKEVYGRVAHDLEQHADNCIKKLTFAGCEIAAVMIQNCLLERKSSIAKIGLKFQDEGLTP